MSRSEEWKRILWEKDEQVRKLTELLDERDRTIEELKSQLDKYQSVFFLQHRTLSPTTSTSALSSPHRSPRKKRIVGISAEPSHYQGTNDFIDDDAIQQHPKTDRTREFLKAAISDNDFLRNLEMDQISEIVECMYPLEVASNCLIIREGDVGSQVYVLEEGRVEVAKEGKYLCTLNSRKVFGELAILYNCERTASVRAMVPCRLFAINRQSFQAIMMKTGLAKHDEYVAFLHSIPIFHDLPDPEKHRIADVLEEERYNEGEYIVRQGAVGDTFYVISKGAATVTQSLPTPPTESRQREKVVRTLKPGDYFGEQALKGEDLRTANVVASGAEGTHCLALDRGSFEQLLSGLREIEAKNYSEHAGIHDAIAQEFAKIQLSDLQTVSTLGVGGFGRVELVQILEDTSRSFALKIMKKTHIIKTKQQKHILSEKLIMTECSCEFIVKLYNTYQDIRNLYMVMETCLGGELWTILRDNGSFNDHTARFFVACALEALEYLHHRGIIYRDLKPENMLLDNRGFAKLVDFGFSKKIGFGKKTWTFCGTPEYVAPEVILNKGHDFAVDFWSTGVFMYELLTGTPPFSASDPMRTYNLILKGVDALDFPKKMSRASTVLIKKLCRELPGDRLGCNRGGFRDVRRNRWFEGFNFEGLRNRTLEPPLAPSVAGPTDTSNFDNYPNEEEESDAQFQDLSDHFLEWDE